MMPDSAASAPALIRLHASDNVAITRIPLEGGHWVEEQAVTLREPVPRGHKVATQPIQRGEAVRKYGQTIGFTTMEIAPGQHVHTHNMAMGELDLKHEFCADAQPPAPLPADMPEATFAGYLRADSRVGTRNYIAVLSSVNCSATVSKAVAAHFAVPGRLDDFPHVDGVIALTHGGGCAINMLGEGYRYLTRVLAGYATHPNVGAVLMIGLGCETNQIPALLAAYGLDKGPRLRTLVIQENGGTRRTIAAAVEEIEAMLPMVDMARRTTQPASAITLALECGGSDGYSGISANPALGYASDLLVRHGGTAVLAETPEIFGAEHLLTRRAATPEVANRLLDRIDWWRNYAARGEAELNNNPSHGNKAGGLTTILEKSLGAVAKGGASRLNAVYGYGERIDARGFVFMDTPGFDPVAVTGQIAGGCNMICFTTGRGSVSGFKPTPSIKLATNTPLFDRMREDMDIDCGTIVTGRESIAEVGERIFAMILAAASGAPTTSETLGYGDSEFVPWHVGAVM
jgi:galactarate dehydratase